MCTFFNKNWKKNINDAVKANSNDIYVATEEAE